MQPTRSGLKSVGWTSRSRTGTVITSRWARKYLKSPIGHTLFPGVVYYLSSYRVDDSRTLVECLADMLRWLFDRCSRQSFLGAFRGDRGRASATVRNVLQMSPTTSFTRDDKNVNTLCLLQGPPTVSQTRSPIMSMIC